MNYGPFCCRDQSCRNLKKNLIKGTEYLVQYYWRAISLIFKNSSDKNPIKDILQFCIIHSPSVRRHTFGFRIIIKVPLSQIFSNFHTLLCTIKYRLSLITVYFTFTVHEYKTNISPGWGYGCLTPLLTILQLYHGGQFNWWRKLEYPEKPPTCANHWQTLTRESWSGDHRYPRIPNFHPETFKVSIF
jgi:hypothetical protein